MKESLTPPLAFPRTYSFDIRRRESRLCILDSVRRRFVVLTPEEWVRQNLVEYLVQDVGCPRSLLAVETGLSYHGKPFRADVIVHSRTGTPLLLAECKEPGTRLDQSVFDQIDTYNQVLGARYLLVTNGYAHHCWCIDTETGKGAFIDVLPAYEQM